MCEIDCFFYRFISIPAHSIFALASSPSVTNYFVDDVLDCTTRILLVCLFSRFCFMRIYHRSLSLFVRCLITITFDLEVWRMSYADNGDCMWYAALDYSYGAGSHF